MIYKITSNNKTFTVSFPKESILETARNHAKQYADDTYSAYDTSPEWGDPCLTEEEYNANAEKFIDEINKIDESTLTKVVQNLPKKKNGKLMKNRIAVLCSCGNTTVIHEWHNTWIYDQVYAKAVDEDNVEIILREYTDTPG